MFLLIPKILTFGLPKVPKHGLDFQALNINVQTHLQTQCENVSLSLGQGCRVAPLSWPTNTVL